MARKLRLKVIPGLLKKRWAMTIKDPYRKPIAQILYECFLFALNKKTDPRQYLNSFLYRKAIKNPNVYLSHKEYLRLRQLVVKPNFATIFFDKLLFQQHFEKTSIPLPVYLGHLQEGKFYQAQGTVIPIKNQSDFEQLSKDLLRGGRKSYFAKPIKAYGGMGACKVTLDSNWNEIYPMLASTSYIFQETLQQHNDLNIMYSYSINTLRAMTCQLPNRMPQVACARMRFGRGGMVVDNGTSGGFHAGVDLSSGKIKSIGFRAPIYGVNTYEQHPDTGVPIKGFQIPMFQEGLALATAAAAHLPYPLAGWDVAFRPEGPLVIEGNGGQIIFGMKLLVVPIGRTPYRWNL